MCWERIRRYDNRRMLIVINYKMCSGDCVCESHRAQVSTQVPALFLPPEFISTEGPKAGRGRKHMHMHIADIQCDIKRGNGRDRIGHLATLWPEWMVQLSNLWERSDQSPIHLETPRRAFTRQMTGLKRQQPRNPILIIRGQVERSFTKTGGSSTRRHYFRPLENSAP